MLKSHVMMAFGLLMIAIYAVRLASGFSLSNGVDLGEVYLIGGLGLAGALLTAFYMTRQVAPAREAHPSGKLRPKWGCLRQPFCVSVQPAAAAPKQQERPKKPDKALAK